MKNCTTLEQIKILSEILPVETADMVLLHDEPYETSDSLFDGIHEALCVPFAKYDKGPKTKYRNISYFPCWSAGALADLLPASFSIDKSEFTIDPRKYKFGNGFLYQIAYGNYGSSGRWSDMINSKESASLVEVCVSIIEALHRNNFYNWKNTQPEINVHAIKNRFLRCGRECIIISQMYGDMFNDLKPNRAKYLAFLKHVETDGRLNELKEILDMYDTGRENSGI